MRFPRLRRPIQGRARSALVSATALALLLVPQGLVWAQAQEKDQQRCINHINKNFAKVAKVQSKEIMGCLSRHSKGLLDGTIEQCMSADSKGKVAKAVEKTLAKEDAKCSGALPDFAYTSGSIATGAAIDKEISLVRSIFGSDLDSSIELVFFNRNASKCQADVLKTAQGCQSAKLKAFNLCKKDALKGKKAAVVTSAQELQDACLNLSESGIPNPQGTILKACEAKLGAKVKAKCEKKKVDVGIAFPGFDPNGDLQEWVESKVDCQACRAIAIADGLNQNCDLFDDGVANASCGECGDDLLEPWEECDGADDFACPGDCLPDCTCITTASPTD